MQAVTTIGLDIAKSVFQVHGIDAAGKVRIRQQLRRSRVLGFSGRFRLASSASRLLPRRTTGRVSCKLSVTPFD
jgi:hypothetical protein